MIVNYLKELDKLYKKRRELEDKLEEIDRQIDAVKEEEHDSLNFQTLK